MTTVEEVNSTGVGKLASSVSSGNLKDQLFQNSKDRTLFCINIDQKCTEEILYELFLQVQILSYFCSYLFFHLKYCVNLPTFIPKKWLKSY